MPTEHRRIAFVAYPGLTPLDMVGPLQVLAGAVHMGGLGEVVVVGASREPLATDTALGIVPSHTFEEVPDPEVIVVPGGTVPTFAAMTDTVLVDWLRRAGAGAERVCSVCTGSLILGAAGLLEGREATTHWSFTHLLPRFGATPVARRWVQDGPVLTAAGVSAGIDMALHLTATLAGEDVARAVQFGIEYDPEPPLGPLTWDETPPLFDGLAEQVVAEGWRDLPADHPWRTPA